MIIHRSNFEQNHWLENAEELCIELYNFIQHISQIFSYDWNVRNHINPKKELICLSLTKPKPLKMAYFNNCMTRAV